jgi:hypothetical protein
MRKYRSPILEALLNDSRQFLSTNRTRTVDEETLLFEGPLNQRRDIRLSIAKRTRPIYDTGVTHK